MRRRAVGAPASLLLLQSMVVLMLMRLLRPRPLLSGERMREAACETMREEEDVLEQNREKLGH